MALLKVILCWQRRSIRCKFASFFLIGVLSAAPISASSEPELPIVFFGSRQVKQVALTFDDGPKPALMQKVLDVLDVYGVKGTFFIVGREAKRHPDLIRRMALDGHEIANHTYSHHRLDTLSLSEIENEIGSTNRMLEQLVGRPVRYFRPPGGRTNKVIVEVAQRHGLDTIMWDVNAGDYIISTPVKDASGKIVSYRHRYNRTPQQVYGIVLGGVRPGSIVLFHSGAEPTLKALPSIIMKLRKRGYEFVTVSEMLGGSRSST